MPGITGFVVNGMRPDAEETLTRMVGCLAHEPYYTVGSLTQREFGLGIGWASHPGSFSDCNPVWNELGDIGLVFSGEHFPEQDPEDARSLVRLYEEKGAAIFESLNGVFCGVVIDRRQSKVILFNDRYGLGRIYIHESDDGFFFSSEAKSLLQVLPQLRRLDMAGLGELFSCGCVLQNRTLFVGISLLPGASAWVFSPSQPVRKGKYFSPETWERQPRLSPGEYYEKLNATFVPVLPRYFRGKHGIGLSLTGGLDSRMILACSPKLPTGLPCYTFGGPYRECADVRVARQLAQACGQPHQVVPVAEGIFREFGALARRVVRETDGCMDVSGAVEMSVNRVARGIAPVRMTGNYGSEVLRGNVAFKPMPVSEEIFDETFAPLVRKVVDTFSGELKGSLTSFIAFKQVPWHHYSRLAVEQSQLIPRSPYLDNELVALAYQAPADLALNKTLALRLIEAHNPVLASIPTDRGIIGSRQAKVGKFRTLVREFPAKAEYYTDYGMPQWLAKIDGVLAPLRWERLFLGRQKFYHFRVWYRDQLSGFVKELLLDKRTLERPHLNGRKVESIVMAHMEGRGNYTLEIHKLLTSELIHRHLIEQN